MAAHNVKGSLTCGSVRCGWLVVFSVVILLFAVVSPAVGDTEDTKTLVREGEALHKKGDYKAAIERWDRLIELNHDLEFTLFMKSKSLHAMKRYEKALETLEDLMKRFPKSVFMFQFIALQGSCYDHMGKHEKAIEILTAGISAYPNHPDLYYNLGETYRKMGKQDEAEKNFIRIVTLKYYYTDSHLALANLASANGEEVKSLLATYFFLLMEPHTERAAGPLAALKKTLNLTGKKVPAKKGKKSEFSSLEKAIASIAAERGEKTDKETSEMASFIAATQDLFTAFGKAKKDRSGFWWDCYVGFYQRLAQTDHVKAFCYHLCRGSENPEVKAWIDAHPTEMKEMMKWVGKDLKGE